MVVNKFTLTQQHHRCYLSVPNTHITRASNRFLQEMMLSTKCCRLPELSILHICRQMAFPPDGGPWGVFLACYLQETFNGLSGLTFLSMLELYLYPGLCLKFQRLFWQLLPSFLMCLCFSTKKLGNVITYIASAWLFYSLDQQKKQKRGGFIASFQCCKCCYIQK